MIDPDQIPDEVVEATAWAMCDDINGEGCWDETPFRHRPMWRSAARAAIAAALNAWPSLEVFIFPAAMEKEGEQKRLGPEFEAAIFSDVDSLYEADKPEGDA